MSALNRILFIKNVLANDSFSKYASNTNETRNENENTFVYSVINIPHPSKAEKGGEDAFYTNNKIIAVADGVGGWNEKNIDPALYSNELCRNVQQIFETDTEYFIRKPKDLIIKSAKKTKKLGSSTLCLLTIDPNKPIVNSAYIGDSGYIIFSFDDSGALKLLFESEEQTKDFNFPFQIGHVGDPPEESIDLQHKIQENDIIVLGSDGLFDNMDSEMIRKFLQEKIENKIIKDLDETTKQLGKLCFSYSNNKKYDSPFAQRARKYQYRYMGGKSDDITIVLAQIKLRKIQEEL